MRDWWSRVPAPAKAAIPALLAVALIVPLLVHRGSRPRPPTPSSAAAASGSTSNETATSTSRPPGASAGASANPTTAGGSRATGSAGGATTPSPVVAPPDCASPSAASDSFDPSPSGSGTVAQPEARFGTIGTEVPPGEAAMVRFRFCVTAAGPVRLSVDANTGSPSPPNLAQLAACLTYAGGSCSPHVPFLNPSYFDIGDAEVKRHRLYELRVENVGPGAIRFADMNVSWTSTAHWMRVLDVTIGAYPNDCVDAAGGDYLGCQAKFRWPTGAGGSATIAASYTGSGTFELKVKTRVDPAAICRGTISNGKPAKCAVVHEPEGDWWHATVKKYTAGKPSPPTFTITWP